FSSRFHPIVRGALEEDKKTKTLLGGYGYLTDHTLIRTTLVLGGALSRL
ncbi:unnamed protein product, partial [Musa acuminata subsp. burmannicoides]